MRATHSMNVLMKYLAIRRELPFRVVPEVFECNMSVCELLFAWRVTSRFIGAAVMSRFSFECSFSFLSANWSSFFLFSQFVFNQKVETKNWLKCKKICNLASVTYCTGSVPVLSRLFVSSFACVCCPICVRQALGKHVWNPDFFSTRQIFMFWRNTIGKGRKRLFVLSEKKGGSTRHAFSGKIGLTAYIYHASTAYIIGIIFKKP